MLSDWVAVERRESWAKLATEYLGGVDLSVFSQIFSS